MLVWGREIYRYKSLMLFLLFVYWSGKRSISRSFMYICSKRLYGNLGNRAEVMRE